MERLNTEIVLAKEGVNPLENIDSYNKMFTEMQLKIQKYMEDNDILSEISDRDTHKDLKNVRTDMKSLIKSYKKGMTDLKNQIYSEVEQKLTNSAEYNKYLDETESLIDSNIKKFEKELSDERLELVNDYIKELVDGYEYFSKSEIEKNYKKEGETFAENQEEVCLAEFTQRVKGLMPKEVLNPISTEYDKAIEMVLDTIKDISSNADDIGLSVCEFMLYEFKPAVYANKVRQDQLKKQKEEEEKKKLENPQTEETIGTSNVEVELKNVEVKLKSIEIKEKLDEKQSARTTYRQKLNKILGDFKNVLSELELEDSLIEVITELEK